MQTTSKANNDEPVSRLTKEMKEQIESGAVKEEKPHFETIRTNQPKEIIQPKYRGLVGTTRTIVAEEGATALFGGITAGLQR